MIRKTLIVLLLLAVLTLAGVSQTSASSDSLQVFDTEYDTSGTRLNTCKVCHTTGANLNLYGLDMSNQTGTTEQRLKNIEPIDSDGDGTSNIGEINNLTFPGDPADPPAATQGPTILQEILVAGLIIFISAVLLIVAHIFSQMKEPDLRKWHSKVAIVITPLLVLQAISGVFLSADWLLGYHKRIGEIIRINIPPLMLLWDKILIEVHYGLGVPGAIEHILLGIGLIWIILSGVTIVLRTRSRKKRSKKRKDRP